MATDKDGVLIVGGGQAGYQTAISLRQESYEGPIRLIGDEPHFPYQRPPLSKSQLTVDGIAELAFSDPNRLAADGIEFRPGTRVREVDRASCRVMLADGDTLAYDHLVLATGARNRTLPLTAPEGVLGLRGADDALALSRRLESASRVVVVGAGFLGLEFACLAASRGRAIDVIEATALPMGRALSRPAADAIVAYHEANSIAVHRRASVRGFSSELGHVTGLVLDDGREFAADLVMVGIGVVPNVELAEASGLACANGILVDETLRTRDPRVFAIGDCAAFASESGVIRLESVQNAMGHARHVAATIVGNPRAYRELPWFWSEQGGLRLQIAGLSTLHDEAVALGSIEDSGLVVFCFRAGRLVSVETVNRPGEHMAARRTLASGRVPDRALFDNPAFNLRAWVREG